VKEFTSNVCVFLATELAETFSVLGRPHSLSTTINRLLRALNTNPRPPIKHLPSQHATASLYQFWRRLAGSEAPAPTLAPPLSVIATHISRLRPAIGEIGPASFETTVELPPPSDTSIHDSPKDASQPLLGSLYFSISMFPFHFGYLGSLLTG
jgi:hypothetical protein